LVTHYLTRALGTKLFHLHHLCHPSPQLLDALSFLQIHHCRRRVCPVNLSFFISNRKFILPTPELDRGEKKYTLRRRSLLSIRRATGGLPCHSGFSPSFHAKPFPGRFFSSGLGSSLSKLGSFIVRASIQTPVVLDIYLFILHSRACGSFASCCTTTPRSKRRIVNVAASLISQLALSTCHPPQILCFAGLMWLELSLYRSGHTVICALHTSPGV
jgi:hypothetical protein